MKCPKCDASILVNRERMHSHPTKCPRCGTSIKVSEVKKLEAKSAAKQQGRRKHHDSKLGDRPWFQKLIIGMLVLTVIGVLIIFLKLDPKDSDSSINPQLETGIKQDIGKGKPAALASNDGRQDTSKSGNKNTTLTNSQIVSVEEAKLQRRLSETEEKKLAIEVAVDEVVPDALRANPLGYALVGKQTLQFSHTFAVWDTRSKKLEIGFFTESIRDTQENLMLKRNSIEAGMKRSDKPFVALAVYFSREILTPSIQGVERYQVIFYNILTQRRSLSFLREGLHQLDPKNENQISGSFTPGESIRGRLLGRDIDESHEFVWDLRFDLKPQGE